MNKRFDSRLTIVSNIISVNCNISFANALYLGRRGRNFQSVVVNIDGYGPDTGLSISYVNGIQTLLCFYVIVIKAATISGDAHISFT